MTNFIRAWGDLVPTWLVATAAVAVAMTLLARARHMAPGRALSGAVLFSATLGPLLITMTRRPLADLPGFTPTVIWNPGTPEAFGGPVQRVANILMWVPLGAALAAMLHTDQRRRGWLWLGSLPIVVELGQYLLANGGVVATSDALAGLVGTLAGALATRAALTRLWRTNRESAPESVPHVGGPRGQVS